MALVVKKKPPANAGDVRDKCLTVGWEDPPKVRGNPLKYSWLENSMTEKPGKLQFIGPHRTPHRVGDG